jgi:hypothetical protein
LFACFFGFVFCLLGQQSSTPAIAGLTLPRDEELLKSMLQWLVEQLDRKAVTQAAAAAACIWSYTRATVRCLVVETRTAVFVITILMCLCACLLGQQSSRQALTDLISRRNARSKERLTLKLRWLIEQFDLDSVTLAIRRLHEKGVPSVAIVWDIVDVREDGDDAGADASANASAEAAAAAAEAVAEAAAAAAAAAAVAAAAAAAKAAAAKAATKAGDPGTVRPYEPTVCCMVVGRLSTLLSCVWSSVIVAITTGS